MERGIPTSRKGQGRETLRLTFRELGVKTTSSNSGAPFAITAPSLTAIRRSRIAPVVLLECSDIRVELTLSFGQLSDKMTYVCRLRGLAIYLCTCRTATLLLLYANGGPSCQSYQSSRCLKVAGIAVKLLLPLLRDFPTHHAEPTLHCSGKTL